MSKTFLSMIIKFWVKYVDNCILTIVVRVFYVIKIIVEL